MCQTLQNQVLYIPLKSRILSDGGRSNSQECEVVENESQT